MGRERGIPGEREREEVMGREREGEAGIWGPRVGSWDRGWDIEYDGCGRNWYRGENLDDQNRIFLLDDGFRV